MNYKNWKQYDPEHIEDIYNTICDPYKDVPKQDVVFLIERFKEYKLKSEGLESELQALRENLKTIEWSASSFDPGYCPACDKMRNENHKINCWLSAEINK